MKVNKRVGWREEKKGSESVPSFFILFSPERKGTPMSNLIRPESLVSFTFHFDFTSSLLTPFSSLLRLLSLSTHLFYFRCRVFFRTSCSTFIFLLFFYIVSLTTHCSLPLFLFIRAFYTRKRVSHFWTNQRTVHFSSFIPSTVPFFHCVILMALIEKWIKDERIYSFTHTL